MRHISLLSDFASNYVLLRLGDSGGPLLIPNRPNGDLPAGRPERDLIVGVISFGSTDCDGSPPGVYLRIGHFWDWITSVIDGEVTKVRCL